MFNQRLSRLSSLILVVFTLALLTMLPGVSAQVAQSVELVGMIEAMSVNTITVNQQEINTSQAQLNAQLVIGALVRVEGSLNEDGSITARQVNPAAPGEQPGEGELSGILESINGTILVINGQTIDVTGAQVTGTLAVGQQVRIHANATGLNTWRAREVEAVQAGAAGTQPPVMGEFEIVGTLESISGGTLTIAGQTISFVNAELKSPLVVGALVKAHVSNVNGVLVAREIELAFGDDDDGDDNANGNANANANLNANSNSNANSNGNTNANTNANGNANSNANVAFTVEQAIAEVLRVYPNAQIRSIELTTRFGGTLVWEIQIAGRIELIIDAQTGTILVIDQPGSGDDDNGNGNDNGNSNDDNSNDDGSNGNGNSNDDNSNSGDDGMGGDDDGGDDNSGMG